MLVISSESSFSSEQPSPSGEGAVPADIQRVLSPEVASAAVMSSQVLAQQQNAT